MPPAEIGVHPDEGENYESGIRHQLTFMCDNIGKTIAELRAKGVTVVGDRKTRATASPRCCSCRAAAR